MFCTKLPTLVPFGCYWTIFIIIHWKIPNSVACEMQNGYRNINTDTYAEYLHTYKQWPR